ncbi:GIDE domain-containing protein [Marinobacterium stanieri]|uniref:GIDE domain-containing protein n=1 Tax=Marinobacterium stanieri TaxID=49186 RepID=UPI000255959D|nr:GIDE domain-containing protein [Marinobacterium stanieri]
MFLDIGPLEPLEKTIFLCIFAVLCLGALWFVFSRMQRYRIIADTPTARIRSAPQGYVEIIGHVIAGEDGMLSAPLSGRPCVWYQYKVEELDDVNDKKRWRTIRSGCSEHWFQINDGTGTCLIDPEGAEVSTNHKHTWQASGSFPGLASGLGSEGIASVMTSVLGGERYRYTERLIFEHEPIYALGRFNTVGGGRDQLDQASTARDLLRSWKQDPEGLKARFDADGDGNISMDEWKEAQKAARREAREQQAELHALPDMNVLNDPEDGKHPYLLSTLDEEQLIKRYRWISLGCFAGSLTTFWLFLEVLLAN